jgi:predicted small secreted protein
MKLSRLAPVALIVFAIALAACANTVRGVGRDVKETGQAVEDTLE